ncbi:MAG: 4Fe-4S ferredoxin [Methanosarcinales archaeon]|nr:MAG: NADH:ubiquinone oxidoreductase chain I-like protein [Euryarchaeota archaeon 55_53]KUK30146.1 MAG: NADH:ubiquinone oxidoreductase chain I-like protein [Methanosarcinales archeaon 56_1174]MDI3488340.1 4Fe-4S ferredoxin [Methanosarcinales archaeon]MDN5294801.1 4Fe-4S ferredoxin [Methanosarcinales archaeon]
MMSHDYGEDGMREVVFESKDDQQLVYLPDKCIGCGTCVIVCPKGSLVIGSVGAVARGLIEKDFIEKGAECILCTMCAKVCPTGALEIRKEGEVMRDDSHLSGAIKPTVVDERCVHCGLCESVCPQSCITVEQWLANDGSARVDGKTTIDHECCVHCGWCAAVCPVDAITVEKPFAGELSIDDDVCQACRTCVDVCPCNALFNKEWKAGEIVEKVSHRPDVCIYCGACAVACPVGAITVKKSAIVPEMKRKQAFEKKLVNVPAPRPTLTSVLRTDEEACLGCGNCVIVCPVNALSDPYLAAGHLNELDEKPMLEVRNGTVKVVNQDACGSDGTCAMICPVDAIWLERREVS